MVIKIVKKLLFLNVICIVSIHGMEQNNAGSAGMPLACLQKSCSLSSFESKLSKEILPDDIMFAMGIDCHAIGQAESISFRSICTSKLLEQTSKIQLLFEEANSLLKDSDFQVFGSYIDIYNKLLRGTSGSNGLLWSDHSNEQIKKNALGLFYERADALRAFAESLQGVKKTVTERQFRAKGNREEPRMLSHSPEQPSLRLGGEQFQSLSQEAVSKLTTVAGLINFIELSTLVRHSCGICGKQLNEICERFRQNKLVDHFNDEILTFLESAKSLSSKVNKEFAKGVINSHLAKEWLMSQCKIPSEMCSTEYWNSHHGIVREQCTYVSLPPPPSAGSSASQSTHNNPVYCRKFSPDNRYFFILDRVYLNHTYKLIVKIYDAQAEDCLVKTIHLDDFPSSVVFSPNSCSLVAHFKSSRKVKIWGVRSEILVNSFEGKVSVSPDCRYVSYVEEYSKGFEHKRCFKLYDVETGESVPILDEADFSSSPVIFSPGSRYCVLINKAQDENVNLFRLNIKKTIKVEISFFDIQSKKIICTLKNIEIYHSSNLDSYNLAFSRDGCYLCSKEEQVAHRWGMGSRQKGDGSSSNVMSKIYDLRNIFELERFFSEGITLEQAATLISIYESQLHDDTFQCPESLAQYFRSLPENIRKMLRYYRPE